MGYLDRLFERGAEIWGALRLDNWQNYLTGLGTGRDKQTFGKFVSLRPVPDSELSGLYHQHDMAKRVVALKPQEMTRAGFTVNVTDSPEDSLKISKKLRQLKTGIKFRDGMIWGRCFGGAAILIGAEDGRPVDQPLNEDNISSVEFLHVIDRRYLTATSEYIDDVKDEHFGQPAAYSIVPNRVGAQPLSTVHRSRLIMFGGAHTSDDEREKLGYWDHSVLTAIYHELRRFNDVWDSCSHLVQDAAQGIYKLQGLMSMIAGGQEEEVKTRLRLIDMSRSVARSILLDADAGEDFARQSTSFTDVASMIDKFILRFAAAAEMPVTLLMGQSPAGMDATGESDFRWFYNTIKTAQENDLAPKLERLINIILLSQDSPISGTPEDWSIEFRSLWDPTPQEESELKKKQAETDKIYIDADVILPEEVALSRFTSEGFSFVTTIDRDARQRLLEQSLEELENPPPEPEPPAPEPEPPAPGEPPEPPEPPEPTEEDKEED